MCNPLGCAATQKFFSVFWPLRPSSRKLSIPTWPMSAERERIKVTIWKLEGKDATCEIFTARGLKGGKRNPKLRYFLQLIPRQGDQRIQIRITKEEADHCMALRTEAEQVDWLAEKIAQATDSRREKK